MWFQWNWFCHLVTLYCPKFFSAIKAAAITLCNCFIVVCAGDPGVLAGAVTAFQSVYLG
jgi:hypothetical protein